MMNPNPLCASMFLEHFTSKSISDLNQCDLLELRLDKETNLDLFSLASLRRAYPILLSTDILITLRHVAEGGFFSQSESVRIAFYLRMLNEGARYLDLEFSAYKNNLNLYSSIPSENLVLSAHLGTATCEQLTELFNDMSTYPAATLKLIFTATDINCALHVRHILNLAKANRRATVCHAMGEQGEPSRILGALWGNAWTYISPDNNPT
ncbi:hypothetical protein CHS0354_000414, partial [Potamilus streckersoni]